MISNEILPEICSKFMCQKCSKKYKDNSGLWRHKKKCLLEEEKLEEDEKEESINSNEISQELILNVLQQNKESRTSK
jgi:hypothetical protein